MDWLSDIPLHVVADREFASLKLAEWLKNIHGIGATLRMKVSIYLKGVGDEMPEVKIAVLLAKMAEGSRKVLYDQIVTRDSNFISMHLFLF